MCNTGGSQCGRINDQIAENFVNTFRLSSQCGEGVFISVSQFEKGVSEIDR